MNLDALNTWEEALVSPYEHMWVLLGEIEGDLWHGRMYPMARGSPACVAFDAEAVIKQEEKDGSVIGFLHTHPAFTAHYSNRDHRTMGAWVNCLGKPLVCCIKGTDGLRAWWYMDDENRPEDFQVRRVKKLLFGVTPFLYEPEPSDSYEGLSMKEDPDARPIEDFMPNDERAEWLSYVKEIESGQQQVSSRGTISGEGSCQETPEAPSDGVRGGDTGQQSH